MKAASNKKNCEVIADWIKAIGHHLYWSASQACHDNDDGTLLQKRFNSVLFHIVNKHEGGTNALKCEHGDLPDREWLDEGNFILGSIPNHGLRKDQRKSYA